MGDSIGWVERNQSFTRWLANATKDRSGRRRLVDMFFNADAQKEVATAAVVASLNKEELEDWISTSSDIAIKNMPCLGYFRESLFEKAVNPGTTWNSNDLTDLFYLACAAAYCDFVVCERSLSSVISRAATRLDRKPTSYRRLADVVSELPTTRE